MAKQPTPVRIKAEFLERLKAYSAKTGVPVSRCIDGSGERLGRDCVAPTRLKALERPVFGGGVSGCFGSPTCDARRICDSGEKERTKSYG